MLASTQQIAHGKKREGTLACLDPAGDPARAVSFPCLLLIDTGPPALFFPRACSETTGRQEVGRDALNHRLARSEAARLGAGKMDFMSACIEPPGQSRKHGRPSL